MGKFHDQKKAKQSEIAYKYTNAQIRDIEEKAMMRGCADSFAIAIGLTCLVLHNSFGFGKGRCTAVCSRMLTMFERMNTPGGLTLEQIDRAAYELGDVKSVIFKAR